MKITQQVLDTKNEQDEYHVASFVAQTTFECIEQIEALIENISGAEIHAISPERKIVFTIEAQSQKAIGYEVDQIKDHPGLLSLAPVYHQYLTQ